VKPASLIDAILDDDLHGVETAIAAGADVNALPASGHQPPLHVAIEHQRVEMVRRLVAAGALLNRELSMPGWDFGGKGWTPLVHAIDIESDAAWQAHHETGHESTELTELLLTSGAIPTKRAFEIAEGYGNQKALELLRRYERPGLTND
jgi:ankyrin repeat protein